MATVLFVIIYIALSLKCDNEKVHNMDNDKISNKVLAVFGLVFILRLCIFASYYLELPCFIFDGAFAGEAYELYAAAIRFVSFDMSLLSLAASLLTCRGYHFAIAAKLYAMILSVEVTILALFFIGAAVRLAGVSFVAIIVVGIVFSVVIGAIAGNCSKSIMEYTEEYKIA